MRIPGFAGLPPEEVVQRAARSFIRHEMPIYAAALSYHAMLALFPFLIFLLTLLGALGLADFFAWLMRQARAALPPDAFQMVALVIGEVRDQRRVDLLSVSILFSVLAASTGVRSLMRSLTSAYDAVDPRPVWRRFLLSVIYTVGLAVLLAVAAGALLIGPRTAQLVASQLGLSQVVATLWIWLRWPLVMLLFLLTIAIIYDFGSGIAQPFRFVTPGSAIAVLVWIVASLGFSFYLSHFGNFGATYGSLGGIVVLLVYFFASAAVLLFGAEVNAAILNAREG